MGRAFTVQNDTTVITNNFNPAFIFCPRPSKGALTETSRSIHMIHCACLKAWVLATPVPIPSQATRPSFAPSPACCTPSTRLVFAHCLLLTPDSFFGWGSGEVATYSGKSGSLTLASAVLALDVHRMGTGLECLLLSSLAGGPCFFFPGWVGWAAVICPAIRTRAGDEVHRCPLRENDHTSILPLAPPSGCRMPRCGTQSALGCCSRCPGSPGAAVSAMAAAAGARAQHRRPGQPGTRGPRPRPGPRLRGAAGGERVAMPPVAGAIHRPIPRHRRCVADRWAAAPALPFHSVWDACTVRWQGDVCLPAAGHLPTLRNVAFCTL